MNETFCTDVTDCSAFECNDFLCWDGLVLRPNISQEVGIVLYIIFRILERVIFALLGQINRELLQLTVKERKSSTTCCFYKGTYPTGIYKQMSLRFLGTFIGVLSFILILERNIIMFVSLIFIDSIGVGLLSLWQHADVLNTHDDLTKMKIPEDIKTRDIDEKWLENMKKFLAESTKVNVDKSQPEVQRSVLKFL